jgi:hypothetical protein
MNNKFSKTKFNNSNFQNQNYMNHNNNIKNIKIIRLIKNYISTISEGKFLNMIHFN